MGCFESGGSKQQSTSYLPAQAKWLEELLGKYGAASKKKPEVYPGEYVAPMTEAQKTGIASAQDFMKMFGTSGTAPLYGETGESLKGILAGTTGAQPITPEQTEQFYQTAYEKPARYALEKDILPAVKEAYAGPGYWSSARAGGQAEATRDVFENLGQQRGQLEWGVLQANQALKEAQAQRALGAAPIAMEYGTMPTRENLARLGGLQAAYGLTSAEQAQRQAEINAAVQKWQEGKALTDPEVLNVMMNLLGLSYSTSTGKSWGPGLGYAATTSFLQGLGGKVGE